MTEPKEPTRPDAPQTNEELQIRIRQLEKEIARLHSQIKEQRYGLTWLDVPEAFETEAENKIPILEEVKDKAICTEDAPQPPHIIIEGDNYHALTCLNYTHRGKVDVIYIDPPYNTGNDGFTYKDRRFLKEFPDGSPVPKEHPLRHSYWLSFMSKRLELAKNLLSDKGVIFISIDDNEQANLKLLCDKVFGEENFVATICWQRTYSPRNDSKSISQETEYILVYSKQISWQPNKLPRTTEMDAKYKNPDNDSMPWTSSDAFAPSAATHQGMVYAIQHPFTGKLIYPYKGACWPLLQEKMFEEISKWGTYEYKDLNDNKERADVCGVSVDEIRKGVLGIVLTDPIEIASKKAQEIYEKGKWPKFYFTNKGKGGIRRKTYIDNVGGKNVTNFWSYEDVGHTDYAQKEIKSIFEQKIFDTPKPSSLLQRVLNVASHKSSTILDFFAGSGTTLHATMKLNAEDGGKRQCILVQQKEGDKNICESVTYERNRRVMCGYTNAKGEQVAGLGGQLKYYRTSFVGKNASRNATDQDRAELSLKAGYLLALGENTLNELLHTAAYQLFTDGAEKFTAVYFTGNLDKFADFVAEIEHVQSTHENPQIATYIFCWGAVETFENEFDNLKGITLKAIPQPILDIYKSINA